MVIAYRDKKVVGVFGAFSCQRRVDEARFQTTGSTRSIRNHFTNRLAEFDPRHEKN
jgi:hypothetical protein